jgi:heme/copper-type cytochrome/quinol oxidase subunit 4
MIDPLRPYWPTNRSIAGFAARSLCLLVAAIAVTFGPSRSFVVLVVVASALAQAALLVFEWMELKRTQRSGLATGGVIAVLFLSLLFALLIEARSVLVLSVR